MSNRHAFDHMACQKCRTPIDADASIDQLNPAAFKLLTGTSLSPNRQSRQTKPPERLQQYEQAARDARIPTFKRNMTAMSFIDVHMSDSMLSPPAADGSMADRLETTSRIFEMLSARSDIDHPICVECTELLVHGLHKRLAVATRERDAYVDYLRRANTDVPSAEEVQAAEAALKAAKKAESSALTQLEKLEAEKADLDAQLAALEAEARVLDQEETDFWRNRNSFNSTLTEMQNERDALATRYAHDAQVLHQLQRRSVYNDTFNITHDNHFATINRLRLGRLPNPYVDWPEINAAWGQTCLLLATLAERLGYKFQGYELVPMGSTCTITRIEAKGGASAATEPLQVSKQRLELYSSGDFPINFGFLHRKFDTAMVAFLECLRQVGEFVESQSMQAGTAAGSLGPGGPGVKMPYEIRKDRIHDQSIKLALNKDEGWTKACKYTLTCCKYLLAHANNVESSGMRRRQAMFAG